MVKNYHIKFLESAFWKNFDIYALFNSKSSVNLLYSMQPWKRKVLLVNFTDSHSIIGYWKIIIGIRSISKYRLQASFSFFDLFYCNYLISFEFWSKFFQLFYAFLLTEYIYIYIYIYIKYIYKIYIRIYITVSQKKNFFNRLVVPKS